MDSMTIAILAVIGMIVAMVVVALEETQPKQDAVQEFTSKVSEVEAILAQLEARVK
jgi:hypothetical protein